jgi:hypothetical protein
MGAAEGMRMGLLFKDDLLDEFGAWPIAYIPYGGADFGEIAAVAKAVGGGDASGFHSSWVAAGAWRPAAYPELAPRRRPRSAACSGRMLPPRFLRSSIAPVGGAAAISLPKQNDN